jgi:DUF971 family protein
MTSAAPRVIRRRDPGSVRIEWDDGHETAYSAAELRRLCPCALCVHELTGKRILDPASVADELTQSDVRMIGNYAIAIQFSDGHNTGIYPYEFLRKNDPGA